MVFSVRSLGAVLAIAMCIAAVVATVGGAVDVPWYDLIPASANSSGYSDSFAAQLLYQVPFPRVLFAL